MSSRNGAIFEAEGVTKRFGGINAVNGATLSVREGSITALIGPNGAGKTTFFNVITGFYRPDRGRISYAGHPITGNTPYAISRLGMVRTFQITKSLAAMSVRDNMMLAAPNQPGESLFRLAGAPFATLVAVTLSVVAVLTLIGIVDLGPADVGACLALLAAGWTIAAAVRLGFGGGRTLTGSGVPPGLRWPQLAGSLLAAAAVAVGFAKLLDADSEGWVAVIGTVATLWIAAVGLLMLSGIRRNRAATGAEPGSTEATAYLGLVAGAAATTLAVLIAAEAIEPGGTVLEIVMLLAAAASAVAAVTWLVRTLAANFAREREVRAQADELLEIFNLTKLADEYAGTLSGGQRKLLELARALMAQPRFLLLDEPMAGINPTLGRQILDHMQKLRREQGVTFLFIEHDMEVVMNHSDRVIVMAEGRVIADGEPHEVRENQKVIDAYLGGSA